MPPSAWVWHGPLPDDADDADDTDDADDADDAAGAVKQLPLVRAAYGVLLLIAPGVVTRAYAGRSPQQIEIRAARLLGARQLTQAIVCDVWPRRTTLQLGTAVDVVHSMSMIGLATIDRSRRRIGWSDATIAAAFATASAVSVRNLR